MSRRWSFGGAHWRIYGWIPAVNIPLGGHRILVVGLGRLCRDAQYRWWLPSWYAMQLHYCCDAPESGAS